MLEGRRRVGGPSRADGIKVPKGGEQALRGQTGGSKMKTSRSVVAVDTAKRVFQLHWVDMETGEIVDLKLTRAKFLEHFANRAPCAVAMEACGGSQHWARRLRELGHDPWLLPAKAVRPFVIVLPSEWISWPLRDRSHFTGRRSREQGCVTATACQPRFRNPAGAAQFQPPIELANRRSGPITTSLLDALCVFRQSPSPMGRRWWRG